jgi:hypothetical protein
MRSVDQQMFLMFLPVLLFNEKVLFVLKLRKESIKNKIKSQFWTFPSAVLETFENRYK